MAHVIQDLAGNGLSVRGLSVRIVALGAGARLELTGEGETMAYVVEGGGVTKLGTLAPESLVWLDPGDAVAIEAGPGGLRLLVGQAG
jgi:redox-sensitive bicupin YhaK (pirin superfamily)